MPLDVDPGEVAFSGLRSVEGELGYVAPPAEPLFSYTYPPPAGPSSNGVNAPAKMRIADARPVISGFSLDVEGFELVRHRSDVRDFHDDAEVSTTGHDEAARIVAAATGASRVIVFDHTFRRRTPGAEDRVPGAGRQPALRVHNDYTEVSGPQRVRDLMGDEAEALLEKRFAIINVWRPVSHPAIDWPLAMCDARSVAPEDLKAVSLIYQDRTGEVLAAVHNPAHRWFYVPDMLLDEALLLKCYDSRRDVARFPLHVAFADPTTPPDAPPRESMEFRTIAFFD
jgi:hypothetical protein